MIRSLAAVLIFLASSQLHGQDEQLLSIFITPSPKVALIDGEQLIGGNTITLTPGQHRLQAWYPNKKPLDTIVEITAGEDLNYYYRFRDNDNYILYQAEMNAYNKIKSKKLTIPVIGTTLAGGALAFTYIRGKQLEKQANEEYEAYRYAGHNIEEAKATYTRTRNKYQAYYYAQFVEYTAIAVGTFFIVKGILWRLDNQPPQLKKDENPFSVESVGIAPCINSGVTFGITLNIN